MYVLHPIGQKWGKLRRGGGSSSGGHLRGRSNLEAITQSTQRDPSTPVHYLTTPPPRHPSPFPPTHGSHDVTPKRAPALSNITAHKAGETATDKPDECFAALRAEDVRATQVLIGGEFGEISFFLNQLLQSEVERETLVRYKNRWKKIVFENKTQRSRTRSHSIKASSNQVPCN